MTRAEVATGVTWEAVRELAGFRAARGCALSFYVDLDPSVAPTQVDAHTHLRALVDEARKRAYMRREQLTHEQQASVREGLAQMQLWFDAEFRREGVRGLALFAAARDGLWRPLMLPVSVPDAVRIGAELYVAPLVTLADGENVLVAVVGRERGDVYELRDGHLEPVASRFEEQPRRHDQGGWSQANYQRHVDSLAERHLRGVVDDLERVIRGRRNARLVVACAEETRADLLGLLPSAVRAALAGWTRAEAHASGDELLASVEPVLERDRAEREAELVARWRDALGRSGRASAGWAPTLEAASDARVDVLLYSSGSREDVGRCPSCGRLQLAGGQCEVDGTDLERCDDGLDAVVHRTVAFGGRAQEINTRRDIEQAGGLGALLRF